MIRLRVFYLINTTIDWGDFQKKVTYQLQNELVIDHTKLDDGHASYQPAMYSIMPQSSSCRSLKVGSGFLPPPLIFPYLS